MRRQYRAGTHIRRGNVRPRPLLLAYVRRLGLDPADAEDVVQDLYLLLLRPTDEPVRDWFGYCFGCLQKMAAAARMRERRRSRLLELQGSVVPVDPGHDARLLAYITVEWILDRLLPADAELLRWSYLEDRPIGEIAERLGTTENAASIRLHRALVKARGAIGFGGYANPKRPPIRVADAPS